MTTRVLIIGDSQTEAALKCYGFAAVLNDKLHGALDILLRKFPGYPSEWVSLLTSSCMRNLNGHAPDYVLVMVGRDDCLHRENDNRQIKPGENLNNRRLSDISNSTDRSAELWGGTAPIVLLKPEVRKRQQISAQQFKRNLNTIVNKISNEVDVKDDHVIILGPVPKHEMKFDTDTQNTFSGLTLDAALLKQFNAVAQDVAKRNGAIYIDTPDLLDAALDTNLRKDGYRLSDAGHELIAKRLLKHIQAAKSPYPSPDEIGEDYEEELDAIAKASCVIPPDNIQAYTHITTVDQYSAFFGKVARGKI